MVCPVRKKRKQEENFNQDQKNRKNTKKYSHLGILGNELFWSDHKKQQQHEHMKRMHEAGPPRFEAPASGAYREGEGNRMMIRAFLRRMQPRTIFVQIQSLNVNAAKQESTVTTNFQKLSPLKNPLFQGSYHLKTSVGQDPLATSPRVKTPGGGGTSSLPSHDPSPSLYSHRVCSYRYSCSSTDKSLTTATVRPAKGIGPHNGRGTAAGQRKGTENPNQERLFI